MGRRRQSLSRNLSLGLLVLGLPIFVTSLGILFFRSRYLISQENDTNFTTILNTATQRMRSYMGMVENATNANAWLLEESFGTDSLQAVARRMAAVNPYITGCTVSNQPDKLSRTVFETGKALWVDSADVASYCRPLRTGEGRMLGVVAVCLDFSRLVQAVSRVKQPYPHANFVLVGADGRYLVHPDTASVFRKTLFSDHDPDLRPDVIALSYQMTAGKAGTTHVDIDGEECHVAYAPVEGTDWSLALIGPEDEVLANYQHLVYLIVALILIGLALGYWFCNRAVRQIISPIHRLLGMTEQISDGRFDEMIPRSERGDEIGQLQNSFAAMQQSLHHHMATIHQSADALRLRNEYRAQDIETTKEHIQRKISFIQSVLHQIRTPLNIITGFANMLRDSIAAQRAGDSAGMLGDDSLADICASMKRNAIHLKRMVLMLFDSAETETYTSRGLLYYKSDEVSCNVMALKSIAYIQGHFPGLQIAFETDLPDTTFILTNHFFLLRTLRELLANAAKFSDGEYIVLRVTETENTVRFTVEDRGPGLPEASLDLTLKPLVEMDDQLESSGLGLPMASRHAKGLGGSLVHDTNYHDGCRFVLEMPK